MKTNFVWAAALGCAFLTSCESSSVEPKVDCAAEGPSLELVSKTDAGCGASDGSVTVAASGGDGDYSYAISGSASQDGGVFGGLSSGSYNFVVTDGNGCSATLAASVSNPDGVVISSTSVGDADCGASNGSITVNATEGTPPYQYQLDGGAFQDEATFTGLTKGTYSVVVKDSEGCAFSVSAQVKSDASFQTDIMPIISANCAVSGCHNGTQSPTLTSYSAISTNASRIKTLTGNKTMPKEGSLTQNQIDLIACWVDSGAANN